MKKESINLIAKLMLEFYYKSVFSFCTNKTKISARKNPFTKPLSGSLLQALKKKVLRNRSNIFKVNFFPSLEAENFVSVFYIT